MGEDRRLKIARRQLMRAQIARREARFALANAIAQEEHSGQIHHRAEGLLREYARRVASPEAAPKADALQSNLAFVRSLQAMASGAEAAHKDARDQVDWQMRSLASAETRLGSQETRVSDEKRALDQLRASRDVPPELTVPAGMARKLHRR